LAQGFPYHLEEKNGLTTLLLKHSGWRELTNYYRWCNYNWSMFLKRPKEYCELESGGNGTAGFSPETNLHS
jgi:hypothetical protein